jgi:hypothetical protein
MRGAGGVFAAVVASLLLSSCVYWGCAGCYQIRSYDAPDAARYDNTGLRPLWLPTILLAPDDAWHPLVTCRATGPNADTLQVTARVRNFSWIAAGGPFWTKFTVSYAERPGGNASTKTYYVNSGSAVANASNSGVSPWLLNGLLAAGQEADVIVTFDGRPGNLARELPGGHQKVSFADAPFTVRVVTNSEDPNHPSAPVPDIGTSDRTVTCAG